MHREARAFFLGMFASSICFTFFFKLSFPVTTRPGVFNAIPSNLTVPVTPEEKDSLLNAAHLITQFIGAETLSRSATSASLLSSSPSSSATRLATIRRPFPTHCNLTLMYNRPPKTGSTFIREYAKKWSNANRRKVLWCGHHSIEVALRVRDCIPVNTTLCVSLIDHMHVTDDVRLLLEQRLPNVIYVTSIRYPPLRILSHFLETYKLTASKAFASPQGKDRFKQFLLHEYDPWSFINYHFGPSNQGIQTLKSRGQCPNTTEDHYILNNLASRYDVVLDVSQVEESNALLALNGLFTLPDVSKGEGEAKNERGSRLASLHPSILTLLREKSCVEMELHRALQRRMATLLDNTSVQIAGSRCYRVVRATRESNCIEDKEAELLGSDNLDKLLK